MHYEFRLHAIQKMFERNISVDDVKAVLEMGEVIREYADDTPYPSRLVLGWCEGRPLHVVAANNPEANSVIVITAYEPDVLIWDVDFKRKRGTS